ncbi:SDR family oxidoreductase [Salinisphaera hydrothermalis]|uniref:Short chain dehydrogenase n=1 Tax=Salinisphaera hydrothermalis (strain C41B8) TaxID=1304275 RepID=A0A084IM09_SALHC|nr:SDR family oxidoreductase [Salinisphaera hydrothermalis]KEZ77743.1 short chain dehydrogenase [Salinisphaera hydrothermalis C41B8]
MSAHHNQSKRIAITGAGSGLGRALALRYARDGWRVAVTDIQTGRARRVAGEVNDAGGEAMAQTLDTRRQSDFDQLIERLDSEWGGVDVFVNNAGVASSGTVADTPQADWDWITNINLMGVVRGCRAALPAIRASRGHIVNTASFAAIANAPGMASYNVTKAGVLSLSETLRAEERHHGVNVTVACPAFFSTNLMESFRSTTPGREVLVEKLMARSGVTADDVAGQIFDAVAAGRFLVLTHRDTRWQYRLKRLQPELFFRAVEKIARSMLKPRREEPA